MIILNLLSKFNRSDQQNNHVALTRKSNRSLKQENLLTINRQHFGNKEPKSVSLKCECWYLAMALALSHMRYLVPEWFKIRTDNLVRVKPVTSRVSYNQINHSTNVVFHKFASY